AGRRTRAESLGSDSGAGGAEDESARAQYQWSSTVHGFIGGGAFPRNHTPRNPNNIKFPVLRLRRRLLLGGVSESPNPKWKAPWQFWRGDPGRQNETGAVNFLSHPRYTKDGGVPTFDKGGRFSELG